MDFERARFNMIEQQIRPWDVLDPAVLGALADLRREDFVPHNARALAFADLEIPLDLGDTQTGEVMLAPKVEARLFQAAGVDPADKILEIGTGSGYQAAVLGRLSAHVFTIERYSTLAETAGERFRKLGLSNIVQKVGDGTLGWPEEAPFDRIIVTAAAKEVPQPLLDQLAMGGILVIPVEERPGRQDLWRITRDEKGFAHTHLLPVRFVPLVEGLPGGN